MDKLKYLMTLTPDKFIRAGMTLIIVFLATGWGTQAYNDKVERTQTEQRVAAERQEMERQRRMDQWKIIELLNMFIVKATEDQHLSDSSKQKVHAAIDTIQNTLINLHK